MTFLISVVQSCPAIDELARERHPFHETRQAREGDGSLCLRLALDGHSRVVDRSDVKRIQYTTPLTSVSLLGREEFRLTVNEVLQCIETRD